MHFSVMLKHKWVDQEDGRRAIVFCQLTPGGELGKQWRTIEARGAEASGLTYVSYLNSQGASGQAPQGRSGIVAETKLYSLTPKKSLYKEL